MPVIRKQGIRILGANIVAIPRPSVPRMVAFPTTTPPPVTVQAGSSQRVKATVTVTNTGGQQVSATVAGAIVPPNSNVSVAEFFYWNGSRYEQFATVNLAPNQTTTLEFYAGIVSSVAPGNYDAIWRAGVFQNGQWTQVHDEGRHTGVIIVQAAPTKVANPRFIRTVYQAPNQPPSPPAYAAPGQTVYVDVYLENTGDGWCGGYLRGLVYAKGTVGGNPLVWIEPKAVIVPAGGTKITQFSFTMPNTSVDVVWSYIWGTVPDGATSPPSNTPNMLTQTDYGAVTLVSGQPSPTEELVLVSVEYFAYPSVTNVGPCQRVTAKIAVRNTSKTRPLDGRIWGTIKAAGQPDSYFWPLDYTPSPGESPRPLLITVPVDSTEYFYMASWKIGIPNKTFDAFWQVEDRQGYRFPNGRREDYGAFRTTFTYWPSC